MSRKKLFEAGDIVCIDPNLANDYQDSWNYKTGRQLAMLQRIGVVVVKRRVRTPPDKIARYIVSPADEKSFLQTFPMYRRSVEFRVSENQLYITTQEKLE